jgi:uncharacterized protein
MNAIDLYRDAVLRIGEVSGVDGRRIFIRVDKNKNHSDMFLGSEIIRNISVNGYVEIRKGFLSIIARVEGEKVDEDEVSKSQDVLEAVNKNRRILNVSLIGYIDEADAFIGGTRELPLIGNEAYLLTPEKIRLVHKLVSAGAPSLSVATLDGTDMVIELPIDGLFNSHIAVFGNTGSGKSNTLAVLYSELIRMLRHRNPAAFSANTRFVIFDFNGEYGGAACITPNKKVYRLSTRNDEGDKLPFAEDGLLDIEIVSILAEATDKTQKPFLRRALRLHEKVRGMQDPGGYVRQILRNKVKQVLRMSDKIRAQQLLDYLRDILPREGADGAEVDIAADLEWYNKLEEFQHTPSGQFLNSHPEHIENTLLYQRINYFALENSLLGQLVVFLYVQLIEDVLVNRAQNEHIAPVINRFKAKRVDIDRIFNLHEAGQFWEANVVVINLRDVSLEMRKTIPLLIGKWLYSAQRLDGAGRTLTMIVDEAHNILSEESSRESESWKDYRLETFEEIIKEGRKFGVFVTIASQRPSDISPTITSQAHNYFIHRLVNERDLETIASAVSYIDRVTEESIPTLPTGTCIFSGVASQMPMKLKIKPLSLVDRPKSDTRAFIDVVPAG